VTEPIPEKGAFDPGLLHKNGGRFIDLFRGDARPNKVAYTIQNIARGAAGLPHFFDFSGAFDRNHAELLLSISREISANTASRSRLPSIRCRIDILP
jgi:hypothetical protein